MSWRKVSIARGRTNHRAGGSGANGLKLQTAGVKIKHPPDIPICKGYAPLSAEDLHAVK
jgi:hypothetical protein